MSSLVSQRPPAASRLSRNRSVALLRIGVCGLLLSWVGACSSADVQDGQLDGGGDATITADAAGSVPDGPYAQRVVTYAPGDGAGFGQDKMPLVVLGGPQGKGANSGSFDVVSLGCGGSIVLGLAPKSLNDGPGADLIVFENPFSVWLELGQVAVSEDGETWTSWPCEHDNKAGGYPGCAGVNPVLANGLNGIDPMDHSKAGGDAFDLATIGVKHANFVRITDLKTQSCDAPTAGFDLDAIVLLH